MWWLPRRRFIIAAGGVVSDAPETVIPKRFHDAIKYTAMLKRVRHHTNDQGLKGIRRDMAIWAARGWMQIEAGVHVEIEPFGPIRPGRKGPKEELDCCGEGAFVEFDAPKNLVEYSFSQRRSAIIPIVIGAKLWRS